MHDRALRGATDAGLSIAMPRGMAILLIVIVVLLLAGGGGYYGRQAEWGYPAYGGGLVSLVVVLVLLLWLSGNL